MKILVLFQIVSQKKFLDEMEKKEREKSNKGRKKKGSSRTENDNISDDSNNEIEVEDESNEEEIEDDEPVVAMQNCWKGLSPPTVEEHVVNRWYGCIYTSKRGANLFIGKATRRFLNDEGGLITALEIACLEQKLGTTDCILKQAKKSDVDIFPVQNIICGPLNVNPLSNERWECPMYAEVRKIFQKYKKVDREKLYHNFVCAVLDN